MKKVNVVFVFPGLSKVTEEILRAYNNGRIENINLKYLLFTKKQENQIEKHWEIPCVVVEKSTEGAFWDDKFEIFLKEEKIQIVFFVNCYVKLKKVSGVMFFSCCPISTSFLSDLDKNELRPYFSFLDIIKLKIKQDRTLGKLWDNYKINLIICEIDEKPKQTSFLMQISIKIPFQLINDFFYKILTIEEAARKLQIHVENYQSKTISWSLKLIAMQMLDK